MQISVFVPQYGVIEAITPPFRTFNTANEILIGLIKKPLFQVEYVGLNEYVPANNHAPYHLGQIKLISPK